jgi:hypothetical protein
MFHALKFSHRNCVMGTGMGTGSGEDKIEIIYYTFLITHWIFDGVLWLQLKEEIISFLCCSHNEPSHMFTQNYFHNALVRTLSCVPVKKKTYIYMHRFDHQMGIFYYFSHFAEGNENPLIIGLREQQNCIHYYYCYFY